MPASPELPASLGLLLQALCGQALSLQTLAPAAPEAPTARPILNPTHLLLPALTGPLQPAPLTPPPLLLPALTGPLQRAAVAHAAAHLLYSAPGQPTATLKPLGLAVVSA